MEGGRGELRAARLRAVPGCPCACGGRALEFESNSVLVATSPWLAAALGVRRGMGLVDAVLAK